MTEGADADTGIGDRLREIRESLKLTQPQMAEALGGTAPGYKQNERGIALPNSKLLIALYHKGINVNWVLSGEGPMMRAELGKTAFNMEALTKALAVMIQTAEPTETPLQTAKKAIQFYTYLLDEGMIGPDGTVRPKQSDAA